MSADTIRYAEEYNRKYLHWDELRYREFGESNRDDVWRMMKVMRIMTYNHVRISDLKLSYCVSNDYIQRTLHEIDSRIPSGFLSSEKIDDKRQIMLSISSMMEESIASSQLEGASTTTKLAKKLLRSNLEPKDRSQRMIYNNYRAMQLLKEHLNEPLSSELIKEIHMTITDGLMEDPNSSGRFRTDDSVAVRDVYEDITYHIPVRHETVPAMIDDLCRYVNDEKEFVHPIIKGIIIHYILAYIHPFLDGNGRVSRALFYWYCLKRGYSMMEYLSLSKVIKNHRQRYDMAYLLSETDDDDITYFILYNLRMISEAIDVFDSYLRKKMKEQEDSKKGLEQYGLSFRQSQIVKDMMHDGEPISQYELSVKYQTSVPTIRRDLIKLMDVGLVRTSGKDGHRQLYVYDADR
ncbi:MAG: Fic family protein [Candidatus Methanomethylophilaceae archaeon]|nr:Fic family protein [Candidatus Methanomethylophilaceae archaeon]